jgi:ABC-type bacteriocin/lantibiotic exporter with double-glycine peptidase domain
VQQRRLGECLAACAMMVLDYFDIPINYQRLLRLLRVKQPEGTPFYNIQEISKQGISVIDGHGTLPELYNHLCDGHPCIVSVQTEELPHWQHQRSQHALLVVGMDEDHVYVNDPEFPQAPIRVPTGDFLLAWMEQEERYAVLIP